jgi:hypothetical protein
MTSIGSGSNSASANKTRTDGQLPPELYLDRHGITTCVRDALSLLVENRPRDPISFLASYFRSVVDGSSPFDRALQYIRMTVPTASSSSNTSSSSSSHDAFSDNILSAYMALDSDGNGVKSSDVVRLIRAVLSDLPHEVSRAVLSRLHHHGSHPNAEDGKQPSRGRNPGTAASEKESTIGLPEFTSLVRRAVFLDDVFREAESLMMTNRLPALKVEILKMIEKRSSWAAESAESLSRVVASWPAASSDPAWSMQTWTAMLVQACK